MTKNKDESLQLSDNATGFLSKLGAEEGFSYWEQQMALSLDEISRKKHALVENLARASDLFERSSIERELSHFLERESLLLESLSEMREEYQKLQRHFEIFHTGHHRQDRAIIYLAKLSGNTREDVQKNFGLFVQLLVHSYQHSVHRKLQIRDESYLEDFTAFRNGTHEFQKEIEALAAIEEEKLRDGSEEEKYSSFIRLVRDRWRLELVRKGLRNKSADVLVREVRKELGSEILSAQMEAMAERKKREASEQKAQQLAQEVSKLRRLRSDDEAWIARARQRLVKLRQHIIAEVRAIRREEEVQAQRGEVLQYHPEYGFLMCEAWSRLREEIAKGEWELLSKDYESQALTDRYFFQKIEELLQSDDFEERFFQDNHRRLTERLNFFLRGEGTLKDLLDLAEQLGIYHKTVEAWLRIDFRRLQNRDYQRFIKGIHPLQEDLAGIIERTFGRSIDLAEWQKLWDKHPYLFVKSIDRKRIVD